MRALYRERMQHGTILNEKLMPFPNGIFPDSHVEMPLESGPSPAARQSCFQRSGVSGWGNRGRAGSRERGRILLLGSWERSRHLPSSRFHPYLAAPLRPPPCQPRRQDPRRWARSCWGASHPLPDTHLITMLPLQRKRNGGKK